MGLSLSLANALAGMRGNQSGLEVVSRNVANAGTPGYHKQSLNIASVEANGSSTIRTMAVERAFSASLQKQYNNAISSTSFAHIRADFMTRMETFFGMPGEANSLDTQYAGFENALTALSGSPDDYAVRAQVVNSATTLVQTLNRLSSSVQNLRQETEDQISSEVARLNKALTSLADINIKMADAGMDQGSKAGLYDERDRLVADVAEIIDVQVDYRENGTVSLMTKTGLGLLDGAVSQFSFDPAGNLSATSLLSLDPSESGVGSLSMTTVSGLNLDLVQQGVLRSGSLAALVELRDTTLVDVQSQLDDIAASLALALSSVESQGTAAVDGDANGFEIDLANLQPGNSFTLNYTEGGNPQTVKVVRVDDANNLPMDYVDENGVRVLGIDFSTGVGDAATDLQAALGAGLVVSNPSGDTLRILDDGLAATTDVNSLSARTTVTAHQGQGLGINLFVDGAMGAFTDSLDGQGQRLGFASRIAVNGDIRNDNSLLVQYEAGGSLGDATRANHILEQLQSAMFTGDATRSTAQGKFKLSGNVQQLVAQMLNYQGGAIAGAQSAGDTEAIGLETLNLRLENEYGVNVDEEMARLMELQNAYAANARVISIVQELMDRLMAI